MGAIINDRIARLIEWQKHVLTEAGRSEFLQRLALSGDVKAVCEDMDLPVTQVVAFLAHHAELDDAAYRALKRYSHSLVAETLEIARESGDAKLHVSTNLKVAGMFNRPVYGDSVKIDHTVTVGISSALQAISERRRAQVAAPDISDAVVVSRETVNEGAVL
jgi:hypothetical protein